MQGAENELHLKLPESYFFRTLLVAGDRLVGPIFQFYPLRAHHLARQRRCVCRAILRANTLEQMYSQNR
jgi:hypothetical protein